MGCYNSPLHPEGVFSQRGSLHPHRPTILIILGAGRFLLILIILEARLATIDSIVMLAGDLGATLVSGYQRDPLLGTATPNTIQGELIGTLSANTGETDFHLDIEVLTIADTFFDTIIVTDVTTTPTPFALYQQIDATITVEGGTDTRWTWDGAGGATFFVIGDTYRLDFIKDSPPLTSPLDTIALSFENSIFNTIKDSKG